MAEVTNRAYGEFFMRLMGKAMNPQDPQGQWETLIKYYDRNFKGAIASIGQTGKSFKNVEKVKDSITDVLSNHIGPNPPEPYKIADSMIEITKRFYLSDYVGYVTDGFSEAASQAVATAGKAVTSSFLPYVGLTFGLILAIKLLGPPKLPMRRKVSV